MIKPAKSGLKFIYWFAYYNLDSPSVRYRGKYPLDYLEKNYKINSRLIIPGYSISCIYKFISAFCSAFFFRRKNSMIVVQRINSNFIYARLLKLLVKLRPENTFYDLDDADYLVFPTQTIHFFLRNCSGVIVGSHELLKNLSGFNENILLNTSPTPDLKIVKEKKNQVFTIGWIGGFAGGHKQSLLEQFFPSLLNLPFPVQLVLLGVSSEAEQEFLREYFRDHKNVQLEIPADIDWKNEQNIQERISSFDIGIATLLDDELHRSKSAFKLKQYFNNGIPVLSSDIRENNLFVVNGINGFSCSGPDDFRKRIMEMHDLNEESFMKFSAGARESVTKFDLAAYSEILIAAKNNPLVADVSILQADPAFEN